MRMVKGWQLLTLLLINVVTFNACSNVPAAKQYTQTKNEDHSETIVSKRQSAKTEDSPVQAVLDAAKNEGKAVFVVVSGNETSQVGEAMAIAKGATEIYNDAVIVELNRDDVANASLVAEWRLAGAPLPLILVLSKKGMPTGGYILQQATAENIAALVPSPKLEQVYEAVGSSKYAIVAFSKKAFSDHQEVKSECNKAVAMLNNEAVFIEVDMEDPQESSFMQQLQISPSLATSSVTLVINKQGQVAGQSTTIPSAEKLVSAAKTPVSSGCGPGCGPAGCGK